jgi:putative FmdB family regulatory protein
MPVYTFACPKCGLAVNKVSQVRDTSPKCPYCNLEMERQIKPCAGFCF